MFDETSRLQQELEDYYINDPEELEQQIKDVSLYAASKLIQGSTKVEFLVPGEEAPRHYLLKALKGVSPGFRQMIKVAALDIDKQEYARRKGISYVPFVMSAEIDNKMSYEENLKAVCEAFFRHITGALHPEELSD